MALVNHLDLLRFVGKFDLDGSVKLREQAIAPATPERNSLEIYSKDVAGCASPFWKDDCGVERQFLGGPSGSSGVTGTGANGQVAFWTSATTISGENNLFWNATDNRLEIGTPPAGTLNKVIPLLINADSSAEPAGFGAVVLQGTTNRERFEARGFADGFPGFQGVGANGTPAAPLATPINKFLAFLAGAGYDNTPSRTTDKALIGLFAAENWTTIAQGTYLTFETTPIGGTTRSERVRLDSAGRVLIGHTANIGSSLTRLQVSIPNDGAILNVTGHDGQPEIQLSQSGGTITAPTILGSSVIGRVSFRGYDGAAYFLSAQIRGQQDGAWGLNDVPGKFVFFTVPDGSTGLQERMILGANGDLSIWQSASTFTTNPLLPGRGLLVAKDGISGGTVPAEIHIASWMSAVGQHSHLRLLTSRGTSTGPSNTQSGDICLLSVAGRAATFYNTAASIEMEATGAWIDTSTPMMMKFFTTTSGSAVRAERLRITDTGQVGISTGAPGAKLGVTGTITTEKTLIVKGVAAQTANLSDWQDSAGTALLSVLIGGGLDFLEQTDPPAPAVNRMIHYSRDNGAGKTQSVVRFNTGAVQVLATEP